MTRFAFGIDQALNHHLGGDTGMVSTNLPQGIVAFHAVITNHRIHDCVLESMAHVQVTSHIWRRYHDAEGFAFCTCFGCLGVGAFYGLIGIEITVVLPDFVPLVFDVLRVIGFFHYGLG